MFLKPTTSIRYRLNWPRGRLFAHRHDAMLLYGDTREIAWRTRSVRVAVGRLGAAFGARLGRHVVSLRVPLQFIISTDLRLLLRAATVRHWIIRPYLKGLPARHSSNDAPWS